MTYLEALVLKDTLDCCIFAVGRELGLKDNTKGSIADDLALRILHFPGLTSHTILYLLTDYL